TVFESELTGASLALDIISATPRLTKAHILLDSLAAIGAIQTRETKSGRHLVEEFYRRLTQLKKKRRTLQITVMWIPGHREIEGNELADAEAKKAAEGSSTPLHSKRSILSQPIPSSKAAIIAAKTKEIQNQW
ncbi:hypothetical protein ARMSODRAFT_861600, partial [Armillaria solidipes]